jgi:hypothetical protein
VGRITFAIDAELGIRIATFTGTIGDAELLGAYRELAADPAFDPRVDDLVDLRAVSRMDVTRSGLDELILLFQRMFTHPGRRRAAIVATSDIAFGMGRMYQLMRGVDPPEEIAVFHSYTEALAWLTQSTRPAAG